MSQAILVPLDGSPLAERALDYAKGIGEAVDGRIILLRVIPEPAAGATSDALREVAPRREAETYLHGLVARVRPVPVETAVVTGEAGKTILAEVPRRGIDLIVMSTHGRSGLGRWLYGSVADQVMRDAAVPIVLVSATCAPRAWPSDRALRVLVPLDYSELSEAVLEPAEGLIRELRAELILLSVTPLIWTTDVYGGGYLAYDLDADQADRQQYLDEVAGRLQGAGYAVKTRTDFGYPDTLIVRVAQEEDVDLIAMSTHGSGGVTRLLMGSTATGVVQRAPVPVLIFRPALVRGASDAWTESERATSPSNPT